LLLLACTPAEQPAEPAGDAIDLIVAGDYVVTMDVGLTVIEDGAVAVDDGVIIAVGPADEILSQHTALETLSGGGRVVMPGLVNGHQHAAMTLLRGLADDLALMDWLNNFRVRAHRHGAILLGDDPWRHDDLRGHVLLPGHDRRCHRKLRHARPDLGDRDRPAQPGCGGRL
jgi:hypothetical protein